MVAIFLGGFVCSLLPSFIVWAVWTMTTAVRELESN